MLSASNDFATSGLCQQTPVPATGSKASVDMVSRGSSFWAAVSRSGLGAGLRQWRLLRRMARGKALAQRLQKAPRQYNPEGGFHIIAATDRVNGLARANRYEIARLSSIAGNLLSCSPQAASNFLILSDPKNYPKLLATPPRGFREGYRIGLWVTEFETAPPEWEFACDIVHEVWTPSSFSAEAIRRATSLPVRVVPHAVTVPDVEPMSRSRFGIGDHQFLGMGIMDLSSCPDRKNPLAHVRAWKLAFGEDRGAHLLMKVKFSKHTRFAREELVREIGNTPNISLIETTFSDRDMAAFQRMADVYLSLHRAEGYGLNIHEMLEIGTPVIATGWSGNMDYMPKYPHAIALPFELVPYHDRTFRFQGDGLRWAEADLEAAASALCEVRQRQQAARIGLAGRTVTGAANRESLNGRVAA